MELFPALPIVIMVLIVPVMIYFSFKQLKISKEIHTHLAKDGYNIIFSGAGNSYIAFNIAAASFRVGSLIDYNYFQQSISYIHNYEWKWKELDGKKIENTFFIYISNIDFPVHKIFYQRRESRAEMEWAKLQAVFHQSYEVQNTVMKESKKEYLDFFISHASEDKESFVRPLVNELARLGISVWYDEQTLELGDSLRRNIDAGLKKASYGIVILSHSFFSKKWTQYELDGLIHRAVNDENKVLLPIWHNIDASEVAQYSYYLADKIALQTSIHTISEIANELSKIAYKRRQ
ncbi:toll/interleukin-1 receptor domain-containing protein [Pantoea sp. S62]|uniref:toll/interleukin-1 receptor domain-containing protein n=1 Tax=Pantoea sp. S62 TaxID=2769342 RepID=UPI0019143990|nr:toll/interleukin-1 receptor domain-containing protein [Pantoea sp. S62]MBK5014565.1 toll/interleukin-1 receptor domain-containing protein [Pantoea sp. S62]